MMHILILVCAMSMPHRECTAATAERFEALDRTTDLMGCVMGSQKVMAAQADPHLDGFYVKVVCQGGIR